MLIDHRAANLSCETGSCSRHPLLYNYDMRLAKRETDFWQLASGEKAHEEQPETFWIPPLEERQNLARGQAARLIFEIEANTEDGGITVTRERMWVIVSERCGTFYVGILDNQPASL